MAAHFPTSFKDLLQKKAFAKLATVNADGAPSGDARSGSTSTAPTSGSIPRAGG